MLALALAVPTMQAAAQTAPASAASASGLSKLLAAELARFPSKSGIYVKNLATGEEAMVDPDGHYDSASTIKVAVMILAYQLADQKKLDLNERYEIKASDFRGGSGIFRFNDFGLKATLRDVITQMIITSDNTATDIMIARVGGVGAVNDFLRRSGYATLRLNYTTLDYFRGFYAVLDPKYRALAAEDIFALGTDIPWFTASRQALIDEVRAAGAGGKQIALIRKRSPDETSWLGIMTPRESGRMMEAIELGTAASKGACDEMKRILRAQQAGTRKIPHWLSVPVGHKTGETVGVTNDFGIVYARTGPIVIASYNMDMEGLAADGDDRIGAVSRLAVEYFEGR